MLGHMRMCRLTGRKPRSVIELARDSRGELG